MAVTPNTGGSDGRVAARRPDPTHGWVSVLTMVPLPTSVTCTFTFEAAHRLEWHPGRCRNLHGHSYRLDVSVSGPLDANGVVIDFDELSNVVTRQVIERWDHQYLNELIDNPTAELLAHEAWRLLSSAGLDVTAVRLWETPTCWVDLVADSGS